MSVRATTWAWEAGKDIDELGRGALLVLLRIADHADHDGVCYPGENHLAEYVGMTTRSVRENLDRLEAMGLLRRRRRARKSGRGRATDVLELAVAGPFDQPEVSSGSSEPTNRKPATDQPEAGRAPYIEEPPGTVVEEEQSSSSTDMSAKAIARDLRRSGLKVNRVFLAWAEAAEKRPGDTILTPDRDRLIRSRLKLYPVEDLIDAVKGWRHSPHHRGENQSDTIYNDIELCLRNGKQIETFRDLERGRGQRAKRTDADHLAERARKAAA